MFKILAYLCWKVRLQEKRTILDSGIAGASVHYCKCYNLGSTLIHRPGSGSVYKRKGIKEEKKKSNVDVLTRLTL